MLGGTPTTGFLTLLILTKYKNVNSFGFSFGSFNKKYHYYYDNVKQDIGHKWDKEFEFFKIMVRRNLFRNDDLKIIKNDNDRRLKFNERNGFSHLKNNNFKFHNKQNRIRSRAGRLNNFRSQNVFNTQFFPRPQIPPRFLPPVNFNKNLMIRNRNKMNNMVNRNNKMNSEIKINNNNNDNNINKRLINLLKNLEED